MSLFVIIIIVISFHLKTGLSFQNTKKQMHYSLRYYFKYNIIFSDSKYSKYFCYANFIDFSVSNMLEVVHLLVKSLQNIPSYI